MAGSCRSRLLPRAAPLALEPYRLRALLPRHRRGLAPADAHDLQRLHHAQRPHHRQGKPPTVGHSRDRPDPHPPHLLPPHPPPPDLTRPPVLPLGSVSGSRAGLDGGLRPRHSRPVAIAMDLGGGKKCMTKALVAGKKCCVLHLTLLHLTLYIWLPRRHQSCRLTRSSWFTSSRTTPSNLIVRRTSCPIWGSKATAHNSDLRFQMKGTTTHHAAPLEDDGLYSSKVGVQELQEKNPEENPHPAMCFSSLELVMLIFSYIL